MLSQQPRGRQVSPLSMESTESSVLGRYQAMSHSDNPYGSVARQPQTSPPVSQYPSTSTENSLSTGRSNRSENASNGHISSSSSLARSSEGYAPFMGGDSGRALGPQQEEALGDHYVVLKDFLAVHLQREAENPKPTRARDKLLRLSVTQFQELSTDVYDELLRREDLRRKGPSQEIPRFLLPKNNFHPKRNQARQKLSTLPPERFRQLATDVFYELERRVPRLTGNDIDRSGSPAISVASNQRGPSRTGMRGPGGPPNGYRGPPPGRPPPPHDRSQFPERSTSSNDFGRPLPQTSQSNTIVPNKSTMVEDDESDEDDQPFGLEKIVSGLTKRSTDKSLGSDQSRESVKAYETQIAEMRATISGLQGQVQAKDQEIQRHESSRRDREQDLTVERDGWGKSKGELERQLGDLQVSHQSLESELQRTHQEHGRNQADLHDQLDGTISQFQGQLQALSSENETLRLENSRNINNSGDDWQQRCQILQEELANQERVTEEVREQATRFLQEMRTLSEQSDLALENEDRLRAQIGSLEAEVEDWKARYAKTRTQLRTLKASSIGLPLQRMAGEALASRQPLLSEHGLVNDVDVTNFQMSIDELLQAARQNTSEALLDRMRDVISHVQHIAADGTSEAAGLSSPLITSPRPEGAEPSSAASVRGRVSRGATGLITACKNHASSEGLSPVSLVDAAASNLTVAVVEYLKAVGVRATPAADLRDGLERSHVDEGYGTLDMAPSALKTSNSSNNNRNIMTNDDSLGGGNGIGVNIDEDDNNFTLPATAAPKQNGWFTRLKGSIDSTYSNDNGLLPATSLEDDYNSYR